MDGRTLRLAYDAAGRLASRRTPAGAETTYAYDMAGNRTTLTTGGRELTVTHDASGRETQRSWTGGLSLAQVWDPADRLIGQSCTAGTRSLLRRTYAWRQDGYLTGIEDTTAGPSRYTLDPVGRVTQVQAATWQESYAYDSAGNQTHATWPQQHPGADATGERAYTGTRIRAAGTARYEYDAAGRTTLRQKTRLSKKPDTWRYAWDTEDRLTQVATPDGTTWRYRYDPLGRRTAKQRLAADGTVAEETRFTWHGATLIEQSTTSTDWTGRQNLTWDHDESGLIPLAHTTRYTPTADAPQDEIDTRFYAIITDLIGTPTHLVDDTGHTAWQSRTTLWGTTTWNADATAYIPLRFPGQYHDLESGHHYNLHRHYDPETARYLTPDPLGLTPDPNPVAYVHNPHTWTDPFGLAPDYAPPGHVYRGGRYKQLKDPATDYKRNIPGTEINHMPPDSINGITRDRGPAIQMDKVDHYRTASWGRSRAAMSHRAQQGNLISQNRYRDAINMDIVDIRRQFGNKYDNAIKEMIYFLPKGW